MIYINDDQVTTDLIIDGLRRCGNIRPVIREIILEKELGQIVLEESLSEKIYNEFRKDNGLESEEKYIEYLNSTLLSDVLVKQLATRPERVIRYREERWGPRAQSLYLKNKEKYDSIVYYRLECGDSDIMQEVYFRIKDREETWEELAKQFYPNDPAKSARIGPVPTSSVEGQLITIMKDEGRGRVTSPVRINNQFVVTQLVEFEVANFDENLRELILRDECDKWLEEACNKTLSKITFES